MIDDLNSRNEEKNANCSGGDPEIPTDARAERNASSEANNPAEDERSPEEVFKPAYKWVKTRALPKIRTIICSYSFWTLASTIAIAWATITYTNYAKKQWETMSGQLDEMRADQRPWLQVKSAEIGFLKIEGNNINFNLKITLKNTGKIPATGVEIWPILHATTDATFRSADADEQTACSMAGRDYPARKTGLTIFPDDMEPISTGPATLVSEIPILPNGRRGGSFIASGCIDYFISSNNTHGQTGFRFIIGRRGDNPAISYVIYPEPGILGPSDLMITKDLYGNYAK
jgi:hypothetical protein